MKHPRKTTFAFGIFQLFIWVSCSSGFAPTKSLQTLDVSLAPDTARGSRDSRFDLNLSQENKAHVLVKALDARGETDLSFSRYIKLGVKPGLVTRIEGINTSVSGRNVLLKNGVAEANVFFTQAYGDVRIVADDLGYEPVSPSKNKYPGCSDSEDNDGDGRYDYPADLGCEAPNDESEEGGSFTSGVSEILFFRLPRVADVRGASEGGASTLFKAQAVQIDTGYNSENLQGSTNLVVTRIASNGFYVTDLAETRGYSSLFAFNFSAPPNMRVCDKLRALSGTVTEFYGSIQLGFPTWTLEKWVPKVDDQGAANPDGRDCLLPEAARLSAAQLEIQSSGTVADKSRLLSLVHALVRVEAGDFIEDGITHQMTVHVSSKFGPEKAKKTESPGMFLFSENATDCDFNSDGEIDRSLADEAACDNLCSKDVECTEYSNFGARGNFKIVGEDSYMSEVKKFNIQINLNTYPDFDPVQMRGKDLKGVRGTLGYFSGGDQFTIQARCSDDVASSGASLRALTSACVKPRTALEINDSN